MRRIGLALLPLALLAAGPTGIAAAGLGDARIGDLEARIQDNEILVSFTLTNAIGDEVVERLHSGIPITFRHKVDLFVRRPFFMVPNKLLERTVVETAVEYDSLTRQYRLERRTDSKTEQADDALLDLEVRRSTESLQEAVDWLTVVRDVPLILRPGVPPSDRLRIRVNSNLGRKFVLLMFPSNYSVSVELRLSF